jgi:hypothetical protein
MKRPGVAAPPHLIADARSSGYKRCTTCDLVWFGGPADATFCPNAHQTVVHIAMLCRDCDAIVPVKEMAFHLCNGEHRDCVTQWGDTTHLPSEA